VCVDVFRLRRLRGREKGSTVMEWKNKHVISG
jgi:hypothetical protein